MLPNKKINLAAFITLSFTIASIFLFANLISPNLSNIIQFSKEYPLVGPIIIILWRITAIIIPPLPSGFLSLALIPVFGWFWSFIYALIGTLIGNTIAFFLARHFREPLVKRFIPLQQLHKWENTLSAKKEFLAFVGIRITTEPIMDFMSYVAGLSKISFPKFFVGTFIASLPTAVTYYLGEAIYQSVYKNNSYLAFVAILVFIFVYYIIRKKLFKDAD